MLVLALALDALASEEADAVANSLQARFQSLQGFRVGFYRQRHMEYASLLVRELPRLATIQAVRWVKKGEVVGRLRRRRRNAMERALEGVMDVARRCASPWCLR